MNFPVSVVGSETNTGASSDTGLGSGTGAGERNGVGFGDDFDFGTSGVAGQNGPGDTSGAAATAPGSRFNSAWAETANGAFPDSGANTFQSRWQAALNASVVGREIKSPLALAPTTSLQVAVRLVSMMQTLQGSEPPVAQNTNGNIAKASRTIDDADPQSSHSSEQTKEDGASAANPILPGSQSDFAGGCGAAVAWSGTAMKGAQPVDGGKTSETLSERRAEHSSKNSGETTSQMQRAQLQPSTTSLATLEATINPVVPIPTGPTATDQKTAQAFPSVANRASTGIPDPEIGTHGVERSGSGAAKIQAHAARIGLAVHAAGATQASGAIPQDDEQNGDFELRSPVTGLPFVQEPGSLSGTTDLHEERSVLPANDPIGESTGGLSSETNGLDPVSMRVVAGSAGADTLGVGDGDVRHSVTDAGSRLAHQQVSNESLAPGLQATGMQPHSTGTEALAGAQVLADHGRALHTAPNQSAIRSTSTAGNPPAAGHDAFAAMDAGTSVGTPGWIHAGGHQAEAGFQDPTLGWVGVRADLSGGSVHAALIPGSTEAAQALSAHLPGLSTYLADEHAPVATLTMAAPGNGGIETGLGQNMHQGGGHPAQQNAPSDPQPGSPAVPESVPGALSPDNNDGFVPMALPAGTHGLHISVMA